MTLLERLRGTPEALGWVVEPDAVYHAAPGLNSSSLKTLCSQTPAHFVHTLTSPKEPTPAMRWGSTVHRVLLEGANYVVAPEFSGKGSRDAREAWLAEHEAELVVTEEQHEDLRAMRSSLLAHRRAREAVETGLIETSGYARTDSFAAKIRPDVRLPDEGVIYDLKTCASAHPQAFGRDVVNLGYHIQAAWYLAVAGMIEPGRYHTFRWIALEKEPPFALCVFEATHDHLSFGSSAIDRALDVLLRCMSSGDWFGFPASIVPLELPRWAARNFEQELDA